MPDYIPSPRQWVRDQVEFYEHSGGKEGTTLRDTGLPVIIVTHTGTALCSSCNGLRDNDDSRVEQRESVLRACLAEREAGGDGVACACYGLGVVVEEEGCVSH